MLSISLVYRIIDIMTIKWNKCAQCCHKESNDLGLAIVGQKWKKTWLRGYNDSIWGQTTSIAVIFKIHLAKYSLIIPTVLLV